MSSRNSSTSSDQRRSTQLTALAGIGFDSASAAQRQFAQLPPEPRHVLTEHIELFSGVADTDRALVCLADIAGQSLPDLMTLLQDDMRREPFLRLLGITAGAATFFLRNPAQLAEFSAATLPSRQEIAEAFAPVSGGDTDLPKWRSAAHRELRITYRSLLMRVIAWDAMHSEPTEVLSEVSACLAHLADFAVSASLAIARRTICSSNYAPRFSARDVANTRFTVIGMGKTGAEELNYISDVDVIYIAGTADPEALDADQAIHIGSKLAFETAKGIEEYSVEPPLWPLDANLRPEGKDGAIVRTLESHLAYYTRWAKGWEFQALIKARAIAGDAELGAAYVDGVSELVWRSAGADDFVTSVQRMRERVMSFIPSDEVDRQLKLGPGGIRDIEFTVQLLQLVHGQHDDRVRGAGTLVALQQLAEFGYIGRTEASQFAADYKLLRVLEHRVQLRELKRTHLMPIAEAEQRVLARATGMFATAEEVLAAWRSLRRRVRSLHEHLFYRPLLAAVATLPGESFKLSSEQAKQRLAAIGYRDPAGALAHIKALTAGVSRRAEIQRLLLPIMLEWFAEGSDPDYALLSFRSLSDEARDSYWYLRLLRDSDSAAHRLAIALSTSRMVADGLVQMPRHVAWLGEDEQLKPLGYAQLSELTMATVQRYPGDFAAASKSLSTVRRRERLRLGLSSLSKLVDTAQLGVSIANLTTTHLTAVVEMLRPTFTDSIEFAAIAMGRYGGMEMGFSSDVDLMYVYRAKPGVDAETAAKIATGLVADIAAAVRDPLMPMEVDLDLRPEGRSGPVARSFAAYEKYYERWSAIWEAQALLRANPVIGDSQLCADFSNLIDGIRYPRVLADKQVREIRKIKARVEAERLPRAADPKRHFKLGPGGISDVEWIVQLYQLRWAHEHPQLQTTSTLGALHELTELELMSESDSQVLRDAWVLASTARSAATLALGTNIETLPRESRKLDAIARLIDYGAGQAFAFENEYMRVMRLSRAVFERLFYED